MPTLTVKSTASDVAEILHAANLLGPTAWGVGSVPETHMEPNIEEQLRDDLVALFARLDAQKVQYLLVGGLAILTYVDGRNTKDVDLVLSVESLERLPEIVLTDRNVDRARGTFGSLRVDVLLTSNPLFRLVGSAYATTQPLFGTSVRCASVDGLMLLKLFALPSLYREGDGQRIGLYENDIFMLYERHRPRMEALLATLEPFVDRGQLGELREIVNDIQRRVARVDRARRAP